MINNLYIQLMCVQCYLEQSICMCMYVFYYIKICVYCIFNKKYMYIELKQINNG